MNLRGEEKMKFDKPKTLRRVYEMNNFLLKNIKTIFRLRKIGLSFFENKIVYAYSVSLTKEYSTLEEIVEIFYNKCKGMLNESETLLTEGTFFRIVSYDYEVFYYLEAWRKSADRIGYIKDGIVKTELLHRMSCEQAAYVFKKHNIDPFEFINKLECLKKYDNHADKYVALAKLCTAGHGITLQC